jgi:SEC-C motif-containing protein
VRGDKVAPTAEALMRSRYVAYTMEETGYIVDTHDAATRDDVDVEAAEAWAKQAEWHGLEIVDTEGGGENDEQGVVEFIARYAVEGVEHKHHERSRFKKDDGRWYYVDGDMVKPRPVKREGKKVGRNEPCPCGSGKKYKRCCGRNA